MSILRRFFFQQTFTAKTTCFPFRRFSQITVNLSDPAIQGYLKNLIIEHGNLYTKAKRSVDESKRLVELSPIVSVLQQRITLYENIETLKQLCKKTNTDGQMQEMIKEEADLYLKRVKKVDGDLMSILLEPRLSDGSVMLEVLAKDGNQEATLFARELFEMYERYAAHKDWEINIASVEESELGGIKKALMFIEGLGAPELMKLENGIHRVRRIPTKEKGRVHTTVSVAVIPQPANIVVKLTDNDLVVENIADCGPGNQRKAVKITHIPTGTVVECDEGGTQIRNKEIAMQKLRTLLLEKQFKAQVSLNNINEKIRTYNYPQDKVIEHRERSGTSHNLQAFMDGEEELEKVQENLIRQQKHEAFLLEVEQFVKNQNVETTADH